MVLASPLLESLRLNQSEKYENIYFCLSGALSYLVVNIAMSNLNDLPYTW